MAAPRKAANKAKPAAKRAAKPPAPEPAQVEPPEPSPAATEPAPEPSPPPASAVPPADAPPPTAANELVAWVETHVRRVDAAQASIAARVGERLIADGAPVPDAVAALAARGKELHGPQAGHRQRVEAAETAAAQAAAELAEAQARRSEHQQARDSALADFHLIGRQLADHIVGVHQSQLAAADGGSLPAAIRPVQELALQLDITERKLEQIAPEEASGKTRRLFGGKKGDSKSELFSERDAAAKQIRRLLMALGTDAFPLLEQWASGCGPCESLRTGLTATAGALRRADAGLAELDVDALEAAAGAARRTVATAAADAEAAGAEWRTVAAQVGRTWLEAELEAGAPTAHADDAAWRQGRAEQVRLTGYADALVLDLRTVQAEAARSEIARLEAIVAKCHAVGDELGQQLTTGQEQLHATIAAYTSQRESVDKASAEAAAESLAAAKAAAKTHHEQLEQTKAAATEAVNAIQEEQARMRAAATEATETLQAQLQADQAAATEAQQQRLAEAEESAKTLIGQIAATNDAIQAEAKAEAEVYSKKLADARRQADATLLQVAAKTDEVMRDGDAVAANVRTEAEAAEQRLAEFTAGATQQLATAAAGAVASVDGAAEALRTDADASAADHATRLQRSEAAAQAAIEAFNAARAEAIAHFDQAVEQMVQIRTDLLAAGEQAGAALRADLDRAIALSRKHLQETEEAAAGSIERISAQREAAVSASAAALTTHSEAAAAAHSERLRAVETLANQAAERISQRIKAAQDDIARVDQAAQAALAAIGVKEQQAVESVKSTSARLRAIHAEVTGQVTGEDDGADPG